jgi:hypothetical protein
MTIMLALCVDSNLAPNSVSPPGGGYYMFSTNQREKTRSAFS